MKLSNFQELWDVVNSYEIDRIARTETQTFNEIGLNTDLSDIFHVDDELFTVLKDGTVRKTIVYISEIKSWTLKKDDYPKYHIYNCTTFAKMNKQGKKYRYKKTLRNDGKFLMVVSGEHNQSKTYFVELEICGWCLRKYNESNASTYLKNTFDLSKYRKQSITNPQFSTLDYLFFEDDLETVPRFYASNWNEISRELKKIRNYTCQKCGINLSDEKRFLHTHHIDSNPSNNVMSNLKVLCIGCHAKEHNHSHMKNNPMYNQYVIYKQSKK